MSATRQALLGQEQGKQLTRSTGPGDQSRLACSERIQRVDRDAGLCEGSDSKGKSDEGLSEHCKGKFYCKVVVKTVEGLDAKKGGKGGDGEKKGLSGSYKSMGMRGMRGRVRRCTVVGPVCAWGIDVLTSEIQGFSSDASR